jgi:hypothetical protein
VARRCIAKSTPSVHFTFRTLSIPRLGDQSWAFAALGRHASNRIFVDIVAVRVGRADAAYVFAGIPLARDPAFEVRLIKVAIGRA